MDSTSTPPTLDIPQALQDRCFQIARTSGLAAVDPTLPGWTPKVYAKMLAVIAGTMLGNTLADLLTMHHDGLALDAHRAFEISLEAVLRRRGIPAEISVSTAILRSDPPAGEAVSA